ncbi:MAG: biotin--[acetyl-CoA-carboxylase] ligase [Acidimicrobiales bacterium]
MPGPRANPTRFTDIRRHVEVDSTNRVALDLARSGAPEGVVVVADHQTAGRCRRGRTWEAPPGSSLMVSVVLHLLDSEPELAPMAGALAAADACADVAGFAPDLKWPNDLVVDGRKLGGVLAERVPAGEGGPEAIVLGLGLNVSWPGPLPASLGDTAVTAEMVAGVPVDRTLLLDAYLARLDARLSWRASHAGTLVDDYRRRCVTLGRAVRVELPGGEGFDGIATDVDDDGSLLVASAGTVRRVTAGDVANLRTTRGG